MSRLDVAHVILPADATISAALLHWSMSEAQVYARSTRAAVALSAAALVVSLTFTVAFVMGSARQTPEVMTAILVCVAALVPTLLLAAAVALLRGSLRGGAPQRIAVLLAGGLGFAAFGLAVGSWSVGFDEADAGVPFSTFANLAGPLALAAIALVSAAITTLSFLVGQRPAHPAARVLVTAVVSIPVTLTALVSAVTPMVQPLVATAVLVLAALLLGARDRSGSIGVQGLPTPAGSAEAGRPADSTAAGRPAESAMGAWAAGPVSTQQPPSPPQLRAARGRATILAAASLAFTVVVWGGALFASVLFEGQPEATTVMTAAGGAAQLAAIPLLWCASIVISARRPAGKRLWTAAVLSSTLIAGAGTALTVVANPDGVLFFALLPVLALAAAVWAAAVIWPVVRGDDIHLQRTQLHEQSSTGVQSHSRAGRLALTLTLALGAGFAYVAFVGMTMGIGLAVISGLLTFWGVRAALQPRPAPNVSPAPLRA
jgi:hypothetical protein